MPKQRLEREKKPKDPNKPKAPPGPFVMFSVKTRNEVVHDFPHYNYKQVAMELGGRWKALTEEKRSSYQIMFSEERKKYEEKLKNYIPPVNYRTEMKILDTGN